MRQLVNRSIQPAELGLVGAQQVARLDKARTHKGKTKPTQMWLATSRDAQALPPLAFLKARRSEWGIENGLHHVLDVSGDEDRRLKAAPYTDIFGPDKPCAFGQRMGMQEPVMVSGREFRPEVLEDLNQLARQQPAPWGNALAREACALLAWYGPEGRAALASAKVALRKLQKRGILGLPPARSKARHRLRASGQALPPLGKVPGRVDQIQGLALHLLSGQADPWHGVRREPNLDRPSSAGIPRRAAVQKHTAVNPGAIHSKGKTATASRAGAGPRAVPVFCGRVAGA